jgi:rhodanese-related sulfurtransferase
MRTTPILGAAVLVAALSLTGCSSSDQTAQGTAGTSAAAAQAPGAASASDPFKRLDVAAFKEVVATPGVAIIDVRTPAEYDSGHLAGAVNIDVEAADFATKVADLDPTVTYAVYCRSGNRSQTASLLMAQAGIADINELEGGINAWIAAGNPVVN